jgi:hypothetical protein
MEESVESGPGTFTWVSIKRSVLSACVAQRRDNASTTMGDRCAESLLIDVRGADPFIVKAEFS